MHKLYRIFFACLRRLAAATASIAALLLLPSHLPAQALVWAQTVNAQDSGVVTAGAVDAAGNAYVASLANRKTWLGQSAVYGLYPVGDLVLTKWSPTGELLWRRTYPDNTARIFSLAVTPDQGVVATGAYVDSLAHFSATPPEGTDDRLSLFVARLDAAGNTVWLHTDSSVIGADRFGWQAVFAGNRLIVAGIYDDVQSSLIEYDPATGDTLRRRIFELRSISDIDVEPSGAIYAVGSTSPWDVLDTVLIPTPEPFTGYVNYTLALDSTWTARWIRTTNYITFDHHARLERFDGKIFSLTNDFNDNNFPSNYRLHGYTPDGDEVWSTDLAEVGWNFLDVYHFALEAACDRLYVLQPSPEMGMVLRAYDAALQDTVIATSADGDFGLDHPVLEGNGGQLVLGTTFYAPTLLLNDSITLLNAAAPAGRQMLAAFDCGETPVAAGEPGSRHWRLYPNPAVDILQLDVEEARVITVEIFDLTGRMVKRMVEGGASVSIEIGGLAPGIYVARLSTGNGASSLRFVKGE